MPQPPSKNTSDDQPDVYELHHTVDARNPRNFFQGHHILSDQISRESLGVVWDNLERILQKDVPGDVVEFGCYVGTTSVYIRRLLDRYEQSGQSDTRQFHVYDSFAGLPAKGSADESAGGTQFKQGRLAVSKKELFNQFRRAGLRAPIAHKCWFSDLTEGDVPASIAFAFLDGDFYASIIDSLRLVYPRMQSGSIIAVDDCGRQALPGVDRAIRDFFQDKHYTLRVSHNIGIIEV
jgi:O-methyltransferase